MLRLRPYLTHNLRRRRPSSCLVQDFHCDDTENAMVQSLSCQSFPASLVRTFASSSNIQAHDIEQVLDSSYASTYFQTDEMRRLMKIRNVGILAHVDAGKTTVTERFLEIAGIVRQAGSVDNGNTVTDYLPAERERGITIQSAAISFPWVWNCLYHDDIKNVEINLLDTPGHVDFSVEVNRSVAVLDGAVLVVDAVAGVQAQTETVWRTMTSSSLRKNDDQRRSRHEPLSCVAFVNKMDKDGSSLEQCVKSIRQKLPGSNPVSIQLPVFYDKRSNKLCTSDVGGSGFVGVIDLINMRQILYEKQGEYPIISSIVSSDQSDVARAAFLARSNLVASIAEIDEGMEEYFLAEIDPTNDEILEALRRLTVARKIMPVLTGAALRGKGIEPLLDCIAELLPSPLERLPPNITQEMLSKQSKKDRRKSKKTNQAVEDSYASPTKVIDYSNQHSSNLLSLVPLGHPLNKTLVAFAFKVLHMKGKGSGDGRVVFARVYSGTLKSKSVVNVLSPSPSGAPTNIRTERISSLLEIAGGKFTNLDDGVCESGEVCALVGLKSVVTGDTLIMTNGSSCGSNRNKKDSHSLGNICLAGVASPQPVLTVRLEAATNDDEKRLSEALSLLIIEDPSLVVKENDSTATLLSGLGELHIEVVVDRLRNEFCIDLEVGTPSVEYKETIISEIETEGGLWNYDRTIGEKRLQAALHLVLEPIIKKSDDSSDILELVDIEIEIHDKVKEYLDVEPEIPIEELMLYDEVVSSMVNGIKGSLKRGTLGPYPMTNIRVNIMDIDCDGGVSYLYENPGALRAAAANAISSMLSSDNGTKCVVLEPRMHVEINIPENMVGVVLSDMNNRRGTVGNVIIGDGNEANIAPEQVKAFISSAVPLVEMLGYANGLRSITGGEGSFTAEYKGHSVCDFGNR